MYFLPTYLLPTCDQAHSMLNGSNKCCTNRNVFLTAKRILNLQGVFSPVLFSEFPNIGHCRGLKAFRIRVEGHAKRQGTGVLATVDECRGGGHSWGHLWQAEPYLLYKCVHMLVSVAFPSQARPREIIQKHFLAEWPWARRCSIQILNSVHVCIGTLEHTCVFVNTH